jgi:CRISPR-associated protein Csm1
MSLQVFLQAQLLGTEEFLSAPSTMSPQGSGESSTQRLAELDFTGRSAWLTLYAEVLGRALLRELKLSRMLLGSSSAEQFLLVLAEDDIPRANEFLAAAAESVAAISGNKLRLLWVTTENLGAWPIVRKRLDDALTAKASAPLAGNADPAGVFVPHLESDGERAADNYFVEFGEKIAVATRIGWSSEKRAHLLCDEGQLTWVLSDSNESDDEGIFFPRRFAMNDEGSRASSLSELAERSEGNPHWAVLRGDVDLFDARLGRAGSIEEHIHLSILFKQFFAGELALLCAYPEFWRKVSLLYRGGDDFAVVGSWDALILVARELHRVFEKFVEQNLQASAGVEAKTISMAIALAPDLDTPMATVYGQAGLNLRTAKASEAGTFHLFGRTLEWARIPDAEELKTSLVRLVTDFGVGPEVIHDLVSVYRESFSGRVSRRGKAVKVEKPWRTYLRVSQVLPQLRGKEFNDLRNTVITHLLGKKTAGLKLRPSARVGLEWARLAAGE